MRFELNKFTAFDMSKAPISSDLQGWNRSPPKIGNLEYDYGDHVGSTKNIDRSHVQSGLLLAVLLHG